MSERLSIRKIFKKFVKNKQNKLVKMPAVLGNGTGIVEVSGKAGYVWVTFADETTAKVYNDAVYPQDGQAVWVGYNQVQPDILRVLGVRAIPRSGDDILSVTRRVEPHHKTHEWLANGGGTDPVLVDLRQFTPVRLGFAGGMNVYVYRGVYFAGGEWHILDSTDKYDLTEYMPDDNGEEIVDARWVMATIGSDGNVTFTAGDAVSSDSIALSDIPDAPLDTEYEIGSVLVYYGQDTVVESRQKTDIFDLRFPGRHAITVYAGGTAYGRRNKLNFIEGTNVGITVEDNPGQDRVDVTIDVPLDEISGQLPDSQLVSIEDEGVNQGQASILDFVGEVSVSVTGQRATVLVQSEKYEPVTNGNAENPEIVFDNYGDIVMGRMVES